jgi:hypothetical protein
VSQAQYIKQSVKAYNKYGPSGKLKPYSTHVDSRVLYTKSQCSAADSEEATGMKSMPYRELIDTLLWVANGTRPVIAYAVGALSRFTNNPCEIHWKALLRVLGYLSESVDFCIKYQRNEDLDNVVEAHGFIRAILPRTTACVDASVALDKDTRRSTTGYVFPRFQVNQCHGRVECRHRLCYRVCSQSI